MNYVSENVYKIGSWFQLGLFFERLLPGEVRYILEGDEVVDDGDTLVVPLKKGLQIFYIVTISELTQRPDFSRLLKPVSSVTSGQCMKNTLCLFQIEFITEYSNVQHIIITQI
jgi:hypothetical protein